MAKLSLYESFTNNSWLGLKSKKKKVSEAGLKDKLAKKKAAKENKDEVNHELFDYYVCVLAIQGSFDILQGDKVAVSEYIEDYYDSWQHNTMSGTHLDQDELDFKGGIKLASQIVKNVSLMNDIMKNCNKVGNVPAPFSIVKVQDSIDTEDMNHILELLKKESTDSLKEMVDDYRDEMSEDEKQVGGVMLIRSKKGDLKSAEVIKSDLKVV